MTISGLYRYLLSMNFVTATRDRKMEMIRTNPVVEIYTATDVARIMRILELNHEIIVSSNHMWLVELLAMRSFNYDVAMWFSGKLRVYHRRKRTHAVITEAMKVISRNTRAYDHMSLEDAIDHVRDFDDVLPGQENQEERPDPQLVRVERNLQQLVQRKRVQIQLHERRMAQLDDQIRYTEEQRLLLNPGAGPITQRASTLDSRVLHARANDCIPVLIEGEHLFLPKGKLEAFRLLFSIPVEDEEDEDCCTVCLMAKGDLTCGHEKCTARFCGTCFHTWFQNHEKCTNCTLSYIPMTMRGVVEVESGGGAKAGATDETSE